MMDDEKIRHTAFQIANDVRTLNYVISKHQGIEGWQKTEQRYIDWVAKALKDNLESSVGKQPVSYSKTVCECFSLEGAQLVCAALNASDATNR